MRKSKGQSVAISKLARYASDPHTLFEKANLSKVRYGNKAHDRIGRKWLTFELALFIIVLLAVLFSMRR
tara:strand:- start:9636 stop:9842 length:207 start_codon:yes stop_codon:yes gene_type:complete